MSTLTSRLGGSARPGWQETFYHGQLGREAARRRRPDSLPGWGREGERERDGGNTLTKTCTSTLESRSWISATGHAGWRDTRVDSMLSSGRRRCLGERLSDCLRTGLCLTQAWFPCFILMKSCRQRRRSRRALVLAVCCSSSEEVLLAPDDGSWRTCLDSLRKVWYLRRMVLIVVSYAREKIRPSFLPMSVAVGRLPSPARRVVLSRSLRVSSLESFLALVLHRNSFAGFRGV
ncbi:hypothetical protein LZ31DRAFT_56465 [Colletotrichum somersetense]|nr:hypothetical protein LZ31DRAFT_56465 [Colletotrichum somersetense]